VIRAEDTLAAFVRRVPVDMVVLSTGLEPQADAQAVRRLFNISCSSEGWFLERHPKLAPVSTFTEGVYIAGACQGPRHSRHSGAGGARRRKRWPLIDAQFVELERTRRSSPKRSAPVARAASRFVPTAISFVEEKKKATINEVLCKGCGTCVAGCPSGSIQQNSLRMKRFSRRSRGFWPMRNRQLTRAPVSQEHLSRESWPFSATGARIWPRPGGTSRMKYAPNVRVIRLMCSGRVDPQFVLDAFAQGADGVLIGGCHPGDCHYRRQLQDASPLSPA